MQNIQATNLGKIIYRDRLKKNISQEELVKGICKQSILSKIESGKKMPDKLLADALLQRLGRCSDTLEAIMSWKEYFLYDIRETLQRNIWRKNYKENSELLEKYKNEKGEISPLHQQFLKKYKAVNEYQKDKDAVKCQNELEKALEITFSEWKQGEFLKYYLCSQELHLLILLGYFLLQKEETRAVHLLQRTAEYIETRYYEEEKVKLFPQCMWLLAKYWKQQQQWQKVKEYSSKGLECLTKNGCLPLLTELLELTIESEENTGKSSPDRRRQLDSLTGILRRYGNWVLEMDDISRLHFFYYEDDISLDSEILRDIRKNQGISQGALQSCSQATFSRIERKEQHPAPNHFREIAQELGVNKSYYISRVQSEDYDLYELAHWRNQAGFRLDWEKEALLLDQLEAALDMDIPINRQYIETCWIEQKKLRKELNPTEGFYQLEKILRYTMSDYQEGKLRIPSRHEFVILNMMAGFLRNSGQMEASLKLRENLLQVFQKSSVREDYHTNSMLLLYRSYGEMLEDADQLKLAEEMDIRGIQLGLRCGQMDMVGEILANLACVYKKYGSPEDLLLSKEYFWQAYWLCLLMEMPKPAQVIEKYYKSMYGEEISDACYYHRHQMDQH